MSKMSKMSKEARMLVGVVRDCLLVTWHPQDSPVTMA